MLYHDYVSIHTVDGEEFFRDNFDGELCQGEQRTGPPCVSLVPVMVGKKRAIIRKHLVEILKLSITTGLIFSWKGTPRIFV